MITENRNLIAAILEIQKGKAIWAILTLSSGDFATKVSGNPGRDH